jgi:hypothetical protein
MTTAKSITKITIWCQNDFVHEVIVQYLEFDIVTSRDELQIPSMKVVK